MMSQECSRSVRPRIGVYALAKNEEKHCVAWAASCADADVRVVTDTASTDDTVQTLRSVGVEVAVGYVTPWRWDDAHNLSMNHLPPDVDIAIRLDLDERLQPGWRKAVEQAWKDGVNNLRYRYVWSWKPDGTEGLVFLSDRVHSRHGFRWTAPTHEGLVKWDGEKKQAVATGLEIHHHREPGKRHTTDLGLLEVAVREAPHDARVRWYYARELHYADLPEAAAEWHNYLKMPGGQPTEIAYALRALAALTGEEQLLHKACEVAPDEPDNWLALSFVHYEREEWKETLRYAERATRCGDDCTHAQDPDAKGKAFDLASLAAWQLGRQPYALTLGEQARAKLPLDPRVQNNLTRMRQILDQAS
jgi:hypothetical protein